MNGPLTLDSPLDLDDARAAAKLIAENRRLARKELTDALAGLAELEREYRLARARAYATHADAASAGARDANVDGDTADQRYRRDLARAVVESTKERLSELDAERASLHRLIEFSMRFIGEAEGLT